VTFFTDGGKVADIVVVAYLYVIHLCCVLPFALVANIFITMKNEFSAIGPIFREAC
jgi:hypothetical protein